MKKSLMIFVALVGITAISAQKKKKAPAVKAPAVTAPTVTAPTVTAPTVTAPKVDMGSAGDMNKSAGAGLGLRIGFGTALVTDMAKQSGDLKTVGGAGGTGITNKFADAVGTANLGSVSSSGTANSISGINLNLRLEYDIMPWLYARSGFGYTLGLKNTYELAFTKLDLGFYNNGGFNAATNGTTVDSSATLTVTANQMEIPILVGFNLLKNDVGTIYFAVGGAYVSGTVDSKLTSTDTGITNTIKDIENKTTVSGFGILSIIGGRVKIANNLSLFGEVKFLSMAKVGVDMEVTRADASGSTLANATRAGVVMNSNFKMETLTATTKATAVTKGLDLSYTHWNVGVDYAL